MKHKVSELTGTLLDAAVATAVGAKLVSGVWRWPKGGALLEQFYRPSSDWGQGGPIIEREEIQLGGYGQSRQAEIRDDSKLWVSVWGETLLIAAMRAFVTHKLGEEVEL